MRVPVIIINGKGGCGKDTLIENLDPNEYYAMNLSTVDQVKKAAQILGWDPLWKSDQDRAFLHDLKKLSTEYNNAPVTYIKQSVLTIFNWMYYICTLTNMANPPSLGDPPESYIPYSDPAFPVFWHAEWIDEFLDALLVNKPDIRKLLRNVNTGEKTGYHLINPRQLTKKVPVIFIHCREPASIVELKQALPTLKVSLGCTSIEPRIGTCLIKRTDTDLKVYNNSGDDDVEHFAYDTVIENELVPVATGELAKFIDRISIKP